MAEHLDQRHSGNIQVVADHGLKGTDAALAQDDIGVAACKDVLRRHQELLHRGGQAALEQDGLFRAAQLLEQHEVLHIARAELDDIHIREQVEVLFAHDLGHDRQAGLALGFEQQLEALGLQPLEGVRRGARLERAAAHEGRARFLDRFRDHNNLVLILNRARAGHDVEIARADLAPRHLKDRVLRMELAVNGLERFGYALYALDHVIGQNVPLIDLGGVAHQSEDGGVIALGIVDFEPHIHKVLHQPVDMFLVAVLLEYNDHFNSLLYQLKISCLCSIPPNTAKRKGRFVKIAPCRSLQFL